MKAVIVNADDLGICAATNTAIGLAFRDGLLTSASLMVNMPAFEDAIERVVIRSQNLGIGLHLVLTSGRPVLDPSRVPLLVNARGCFRHGFTGLARLLRSGHRRPALRQIRQELRAQFERARRAGVSLDHVDSHQHVHMLPAVWSSVRRLASEFSAGPVRNSTERVTLSGPNGWHARDGLRPLNVLKVLTLRRCARLNARRQRQAGGAGWPVAEVVGIRESGRVDRAALARVLVSLRDGITEVITHPGTSLDADLAQPALSDLSGADRRFLQSPNRRLELQAILDLSLRRVLDSERIQLMSYRDVQQGPARRRA